MDTALTDPLIGAVLERRYQVETVLAYGGMSTVYTGLDLRLDRSVAIKVMSPALASDPEFIQRFSHEARAAARLGSSNVVSVYDQGRDGNRIFIVMELVQGQTLRQLLRDRKRLPPDLVISIAEPMLEALASAHQANLIHRDVKPENVLLSDDGIVKVADFGLARALTALTHSSIVMGTVAYVAPEQVAQGRTDTRTDVYGAGIVLYEMLTGRPPYQADNPVAVAYRHVHEDVPAPSSQVPELPPQVDDLVLRATRRNPAERPSDATDLLAQLRKMRSDLGLAPVPIPRRKSSQYQDGDGVRHTRVLARDSAVQQGVRHDPASAPRAAAPVWSRPPEDPAAAQKRYSDRQRRGRRGVVWLLVVLLLGGGAAGAGWWYGSGRYTAVPDLRGVSRAEAINQAKEADIQIGSQTRQIFDDNVPPGQVARTDPSQGSRIVRGSSITLVLSEGPAPRTVPELNGKTRENAEKSLQRLRLKPLFTDQSHSTIPAGEVISTNPLPGASVRMNDTVTVFISTGPAPVHVPSMVGSSETIARTTLENLGFSVEIEDRVFSTDMAEGLVLRQDPEEEGVNQGSTVQLVISKGPDLVDVPFVIGDRLKDARKELENAGFTVEVDRIAGGRLDTVTGQDPAGNNRAPRGSTVHLTVL